MQRVYDAIKLHFPGRKVRSVTSLARDSVTGANVVHVILNKTNGDRRAIVVKVGTPDRIAKEVRGYELLKPYFGTSIPDLLHVGNDYIIIQFVREVKATFKELAFDPDHHGIPAEQFWGMYQNVLAVKRENWLQTVQEGGQSENSIIRLEMSETIVALSNVFGNEIQCPIIIRNKEYPSLQSCIDIIVEFLKQDLPWTVLAHGDLKGENILVYKVRRGNRWGVKIIDLEWAGRIDWCEALMRVGKYCSSKTSMVDSTPRFERDHGVVTLYYQVRHKEMCRKMQLGARRFGTEFNATVLQGKDPDWEKRFDYYLAASFLREIVLLQRRNLPPSLLVPLWGEIVKLVAKHS
ncbi:MAG: hypothetical protein WC663_00720 [Patescibacteria group bacterium]|jgi:hypothetical protein